MKRNLVVGFVKMHYWDRRDAKGIGLLGGRACGWHRQQVQR